jgi:hypothetical protein
MTLIHRIRRLAGMLAGVLLVSAVAAPAAFATMPPQPDGGAYYGYDAPTTPVHVQSIVLGGMPGWQITLIAVGAALLTAAVTLLLARVWAAQRRTTTVAA